MTRSALNFPDRQHETNLVRRKRAPIYVLRRGRPKMTQSLRNFVSTQPDDLGITRKNPSSAGSITALVNKYPATDSHRHRMAAVLKFLMERASHVPQLAFHDDELFVEWRFGRRSLELSIPEVDDEIYVRVTDDKGSEIKIAFVDQVSEEERDVAVLISDLIRVPHTQES